MLPLLKVVVCCLFLSGLTFFLIWQQIFPAAEDTVPIRRRLIPNNSVRFHSAFPEFRLMATMIIPTTSSRIFNAFVMESLSPFTKKWVIMAVVIGDAPMMITPIALGTMVISIIKSE